MHHGSTLRSLSLLFFCFSLLAPLGLLAQRPVGILPAKGDVIESSSGDKMDCNDAGEIRQFSGFAMESTSFGDNLMTTDIRPYGSRPDTIFLCADDQFNVSLLNGSSDLSGDPDPATIPGVGYGFYRCMPTVSGPTLAEVRADPCVADNGLPPFDEFAIGVPPGYAVGNYTLTLANDNVGGFTIPGLFPMGGEPSPVVFDIAPITFDDADLTVGRALYESFPGGVEGPCVNVSTLQSFRVAYLNPINVANFNSMPAGCAGIFDVRGGTPELRGGTGYNIVIENTVTGSRAAILTPFNEIVHNGVVRYEVPEAGTYRITIEDGNSCSLNGGMGLTVSHPDGCIQPMTLTLPTGRGLPGQNICFPVTVENFTDIVAFQFDLDFDPAVVRFDSLSDFHPNLTADILFNGPVSSGGTLAEGLARVIYNDNFAGPSTVPNGEALFTICFTILGDIGDQTPLINVDPTAEFTRDPMVTDALIVNPGVIVITEKAFLVELTRTNENCSGFNDGSITASANGSDSPYIFSIRRLNEAVFRDAQTRTGSPAVATFNGLADNSYAVQVVSATGDIVTDTIEVEAGISVAVNIRELREPTCNGFTDGAVYANVIGVANPLAEGYTFVWAGTDETSDTLRNIPAGVYSVTVTAPNGICTNSDSGNLGEPTEVRVRPDLPSDAVSNATCSGTPDGSITVSADGGTGPYDFLWPAPLMADMDVLMSLRDTLTPGAYEVIVEDARGCRDTSNFVVDALKTLGIVSEIDSVTCFGDANGAIRVNGTATGAAPVGNYEVSLINLNTANVGPFITITDNTVPFEFGNLGPARYVVVLRDQDPAGCETTDTFDIFEPPLLEIDQDLTITNETCTVGMDGTVAADVAGGTSPYVYRWVNDSLDIPIDTITPGNSLTALSADTNYFLIVTDFNGCMDTARFRINAPAGALLMPVDTSFISCPGDNDGRLTVVATPPPGEIITTITWFRVNADGTLGGPVASGPTTQNNLPVGRYAVEVRTSNACTAFAEGFVVSPGEVFLQDFTQNDPQCPGDANGSIFINPGGGTPNADGTYNYVWSTDPFGAPTSNPAFTGLRAGSYTVTITDGNGCQPPFDTTFVLVDPPAITGSFQLTPVSCPDDLTMDGAATFTAMYDDGTVGSYDFVWTSGTAAFSTTMSTETGLLRGPVTVRVTDGVCTESFTDTIRSPEEFEVEVLTSAVTCNGSDDGEATVVISGGTPGYNYTWSVATDTDSIVTGLMAGMGTVDITDANGCSPGTQTFTIAQPDPLTLSIDPVQTTANVRCAGDANGRIGVFVSSVNNNDLAMNPYAWSGNVAGPTETLARDLAPGTYRVTVTDVEGCQDSLSYTIGEPEPIVFSVLPIEEPLCFGETTPVLIDTAFGGTSNGIEDFTFSVNNDGFRIPVGQTGTAFAGDVVISVFDSIGCSAEQTFSVNQPPQILIDLPEEITIELGDSLTRLNPLISPAGDVYEYLWTPADFLSSDTVRSPLIYPFDDVDYTFRATNANGCQAFANIFVEVDANRNVFIPNVFSPNRDGRNEDFRIFACQGVQRVISVNVFDRWGGLLFSESNFEPNCLDGIKLWDGSGQNGKPVNPGVFVYVIEVEFLDNVKLLYRGDVTVLR